VRTTEGGEGHAEDALDLSLERAAADVAWLRISLDASAGAAAQKAITVARGYPPGARCA